MCIRDRWRGGGPVAHGARPAAARLSGQRRIEGVVAGVWGAAQTGRGEIRPLGRWARAYGEHDSYAARSADGAPVLPRGTVAAAHAVFARARPREFASRGVCAARRGAPAHLERSARVGG